MSAAHTPAPWLVARDDVHAGSIATIYGCEDGYIEVWSTGWPDAATQEANARLIAAAPEIFDALSALLDMCYSNGERWAPPMEFIENARIALAKATGSAA